MPDYHAIRYLSRKLLPGRLHATLRRAFGKAVLAVVLRKVRQDPSLLFTNGDVIDWAYYGWGTGWAASRDFLRSALAHANATSGSILECGSGLSTLLLGFVLQDRDRRLITLEHDAAYASRLQRLLNRYGLSCVQLCVAPLQDYGGYDWYTIPMGARECRYDLVICDGPPGTTRGGRYGLLPQMSPYLNKPCIVLLDDAARRSERDTLCKWQAQFGGVVSIVPCARPYAVIEL